MYAMRSKGAVKMMEVKWFQVCWTPSEFPFFFFDFLYPSFLVAGTLMDFVIAILSVLLAHRYRKQMKVETVEERSIESLPIHTWTIDEAWSATAIKEGRTSGAGLTRASRHSRCNSGRFPGLLCFHSRPSEMDYRADGDNC